MFNAFERKEDKTDFINLHTNFVINVVETRHKLHDEICGNDNNDFDNFSPVSEVYQAEQIEDSRMVNQ